MWLVATIIVIYILIKFNSSLTKITGLFVKVVDKADDTFDVYADEVSIDNQVKRQKQWKKLDDLGDIITAKAMQERLHGKIDTSAT